MAVAYYSQTDGSYTASSYAIPIAQVDNGFCLVGIVGAPDTMGGWSFPSGWTTVVAAGNGGSTIWGAYLHSGSMPSTCTVGSSYGTWNYQTFTLTGVTSWEYGNANANSGQMNPPSKTASKSVSSTSDAWIAVGGSRDTYTGDDDWPALPSGYSYMEYRFGASYCLVGVIRAGTNSATEDPGVMTVYNQIMWGACTIAAFGAVSATVNATSIAVPISMAAPTVQAGQTASVVSIAVPISIPTPTINAGATLSPDAILVPVTVPEPYTPIQGETEAAAILTEITFGAHVVEIPVDVTPDPILTTTDLPVPESQGGGTATPDPIATVVALPTPNALSVTEVSATPILTETTLPAPQADGIGEAFADPILTTVEMPTPSAYARTSAPIPGTTIVGPEPVTMLDPSEATTELEG